MMCSPVAGAAGACWDQEQAEENKNWEQSFHRNVGSSIYAEDGGPASGRSRFLLMILILLLILC